MRTNETAGVLMEYMSKKLLDMAQLNTVLDSFGSYKSIPSTHKPYVRFIRPEGLLDKQLELQGYKFLRTLVNHVDDVQPYGTYVMGRNDWNTNLGCAGFDCGQDPAPLETHQLSALDREELERLLEF